MLVITIILLLFLLYSIYYQRHILKQHASDVRELINEANAVKDDLNRIMTGAVDLSQNLVEDLNDKIQELSSLEDIATEKVKNCAAGAPDVTNQAEEDQIDYEEKPSFSLNLDTDMETDYSISTSAEQKVCQQELLTEDLDFQSIHPDLAVKLLHEKGFSVRQIAQILGRGQGEISLILKIQSKKRAI